MQCSHRTRAKNSRTEQVRIYKPPLTNRTIKVTALIDRRIVKIDTRRQAKIFREINNRDQLMGFINGFMIHIKLSVMESTGSVVIVCGPSVDQLIEAKDIFQLHIVGQLIDQIQLRCVRFELFSLQPIGSSAKITPVNLTRENTSIIGSSRFWAAVIKAIQRRAAAF